MYNGSSKLAIKKMYDIASKVMFAAFKRARNLNLNIDQQIHLFDITVLPILFYGCKVVFCSFLNINIDIF